MKVHDFPFSPNCRKVRAIVYELGLDVEFLPVNLFRGESRTPQFLAVNPNGRVPVLVDGDLVLWESNAIVNYLAHGTPLLPAQQRERAEVERWTDWQLAHIGPAIRTVAFERVVKPMLGKGQPDAALVEAGARDYATFSGVLDESLGRKEYVAGRLSVADFVLASVYSLAASVGLETAPYPKVNAWLGRVLARDSMKRALADAQASMPR
ncbi:MAG TPA: glutathione S-transferase family protein [Polyangiaceae bacterium]|jgi:glutathione S-transferase